MQQLLQLSGFPFSPPARRSATRLATQAFPRHDLAEARSARGMRDFSTARPVILSPSDRTSTVLIPTRALLRARRTERACTIARRPAKTPIATSHVSRLEAAAAVHLISPLRPPLPAESPGMRTWTGTDETRNSDKRQSARDAGRHHRGRPAR